MPSLHLMFAVIMKVLTRIAFLALALGLAGLALPEGTAHAAAAAMPDTVVYGHCSWDHPGVNPFMGNVVAAVDRYPDIPPDVRARLKARMEKRDYDDLVSIRRDSIDGRGGYDYGNTISDMHFGTHQLCRSVTRTAWTPQMQERGLVYCDSGFCILVPTVCRNVSRITRSGVGPVAAAALPTGPLADADGLPPIDWFGPAGAGPVAPAGAAGPALDGPLGATSAELAAPGSAFAPAAGSEVGVAGAAFPATSAFVPNAIALGTPVGRIGVIAAVPEPETWAMMLLGLGVVAWATARRR